MYAEEVLNYNLEEIKLIFFHQAKPVTLCENNSWTVLKGNDLTTLVTDTLKNNKRDNAKDSKLK